MEQRPFKSKHIQDLHISAQMNRGLVHALQNWFQLWQVRLRLQSDLRTMIFHTPIRVAIKQIIRSTTPHLSHHHHWHHERHVYATPICPAAPDLVISVVDWSSVDMLAAAVDHLMLHQHHQRRSVGRPSRFWAGFDIEKCCLACRVDS